MNDTLLTKIWVLDPTYPFDIFNDSELRKIKELMENFADRVEIR
jgi:hypothetical protein